MARSAYDQGRQMAKQAGERYPEARRYLERGTRAVSQQVADAPLASLLAVGAASFALAWIIGGSQARSQDRAADRGRRDSRGQRTGKRLIESDRVEGSAVYDRDGHRIGTIERVMLDKITGRAAYAVMSFGGFLGFGAQEFAVPWGMLDYDTSLEGYRTHLTQEQLRNAPSLSRDQNRNGPDPDSERQLHDYYQVTYYWLAR
jgi:sporulation protein YlmC with PRC-barrel domain